MLSCVIIDDEPLARECMAGYVEQVEFLGLTGTGNNPVDLTQLLEVHQVDLVFLDIQMPVMNGIDFLKITPNPPLIIITTAYPTYALEGFQLDVLDYLLKPITFSRFFKAVNKARDYHRLITKPESIVQLTTPVQKEDYFCVKCDCKYELIYFDDILYIQGLENYVAIHTRSGKYLTLMSLKSVEANLDPRSFIRVHKSYIVSISKIDAIDNNDMMVQSNPIPIGRNYRGAVIENVVNKRLWKKSGGTG